MTEEQAVTKKKRKFSEVDKKILKVLLEPNGKVSSVMLQKKLGIPRSTVLRRRKYLEDNFLQFNYSLKLENLGFRRVDLFLFTEHGATKDIANELLKQDEVISVSSSMGEHTIDLRAEVIIRDNADLLQVLERVKALPNVRDVIWSEVVNIMGKKKSIPSAIIDKL